MLAVLYVQRENYQILRKHVFLRVDDYLDAFNIVKRANGRVDRCQFAFC